MSWVWDIYESEGSRRGKEEVACQDRRSKNEQNRRYFARDIGEDWLVDWRPRRIRCRWFLVVQEPPMTLRVSWWAKSTWRLCWMRFPREIQWRGSRRVKFWGNSNSQKRKKFLWTNFDWGIDSECFQALESFSTFSLWRARRRKLGQYWLWALFPGRSFSPIFFPLRSNLSMDFRHKLFWTWLRPLLDDFVICSCDRCRTMDFWNVLKMSISIEERFFEQREGFVLLDLQDSEVWQSFEQIHLQLDHHVAR